MFATRLPEGLCRLLLFVLSSGIGIQTSVGQIIAGKDLSFDALTIEDGLSVNPVTDVFQDQQGLLWVGTVDGLNRYDGFSFKVYRHIPGDSTSLADNYINANAITQDSKGYLWIGTRKGLSRFDPYLDSFTNYVHHPDSSAGLSHERVMGVYVDASDQVWLATLGGLDMLNQDTGVFTHYRHDPREQASLNSDYVLSVTGDSSYLWTGTSAGVARISLRTGQVDRVTTAGQVWSLYREANGVIWVGETAGQIAHIDPLTLEVIRFNSFASGDAPAGLGFVVDFMHDKAGDLWAAVHGGGVLRLKGDTWHQYKAGDGTSSGLTDNRVSALFEDRAGKKWMGTWNGLNFVKQAKAFNPLFPSSITGSNARTVFVDRTGEIWVGTEEQGLFHIDSGDVVKFGEEVENLVLPTSKVSTLLEDHEGNLWIGSPTEGINIFDTSTGEIRQLEGAFGSPKILQTNQIYTMIQDRANRIWIGTVQAGLAMYDPDTEIFTTHWHDPEDPQSIGSNEVISLYEDNTGQLWAGTIGGGLNRIDIRTGADSTLDVRFKRYMVDAQDPSSISSNNVVSLYRDETGILWAGTMGGGLNRFDPATETFTAWSTQDELSHANVACILPDAAGNLWLPTSFGLSRFNPDTKKFNQYTVEDGLQSAVFFINGCTSDESGNLYMPHTRGVTVFNPEEITHNPVPPTALISEVLLFNESHAMDSSALYKEALTLSYDQNFLGFELGATDYTIPAKNKYRYKLEGIDPEWVYDRGNRLASYPALNPGDYTFMVEATNNDGVWSETRELVVEILPPFWERWWFRILVTLGVAGLIAGFLRYRYLQQKRLADTRQQIADDLHDDITGNLGALTFFLGRIRNSEVLAPADKKSANDYLLSVQRMMGDLRDVVWLADPGYDSLGKLLAHMQKIGYQLTQDQKFTFDATGVPELQSMPMNTRRHLFLMYKEGLHNAVRHSEATKIEVQVTFETGVFSVRIKDNGKGFKTDEVKKGQGLQSLRRRARQSGVTFSLDSEKGAGTKVDLSIKIT